MEEKIMGFLDTLLNVGGAILSEMAKDRVGHIAEWIDSMKYQGAVAAHLKQKEGKGFVTVFAEAYNAQGRCIGAEEWQIEVAASKIKTFWNGNQADPEGRGALRALFGGLNKKEITYDLTDTEDDIQFIISKDYKQTGPFTVQQLAMMLENGVITTDYYACIEGRNDWFPIMDIFSDSEDEDEDEDYD
jgi:hypothetical protein